MKKDNKSERTENKMKKILNTFLAGISTLLPISITVFLLYKIFIIIDGITSKYFEVILGRKIIGLGFLSTLLIVFLTGMIVKNIIGKKIFLYVEKLVMKIPFAQSIYQAVKELSNSIFSKDKMSLKQPVLVDFPSQGLKSIGFITNENINLANNDVLTLFVPTTPNPTSGFMVFAKKENVEYLDISIEDAMKMVISLGVVAPPNGMIKKVQFDS